MPVLLETLVGPVPSPREPTHTQMSAGLMDVSSHCGSGNISLSY